VDSQVAQYSEAFKTRMVRRLVGPAARSVRDMRRASKPAKKWGSSLFDVGNIEIESADE
jgi:hypothetical protein